ncbi:MAG TPA: FmdB family zinc ribbon protein [Dehalococcoidia bacterium]|nr:FmdB family zinc ribbon protein [Dehalococcoidia bacterium]
MPTYEYRCADCDNRYETREGFDAPSTHPCPRCGGRAKRVLFAPPIVFKGSGFYVTDSRKNGDSATVGGYDGKDGSSPSSSSEPAAASTSAED